VKGYPALYNNPTLTQSVSAGISDFVGAKNAIEIPPRMTAEDFSYYSQKIPACFYRLGTSKNGKYTSAVHTPTFDVPPESLKLGAGLISYLAYTIGSELS